MASTPQAYGATPGWRTACLVVAALTLVRLLTLFVTPLELYPDEAQYWLWSRTLDFGYFSKPPMVAWAIWLTTKIGGDAEGWVRLSAPIWHAGAGLGVYALGRRLYDARTGFTALALYMLMPGVQLSSAVIATDAPLLCFVAAALVAYVSAFYSENRKARLVWAAAYGAFLGLAFLSKYAAVYVVVGAILHRLVSARARAAFGWSETAIAALVLGLTLAPNMVWNARHGFATLQHTAANADWSAGGLFDLRNLAEFLLSQFGVFGPAPFAALLIGCGLVALKRDWRQADLLLMCFALPPLLLVAGQAFINRANANWAGAGFVAAAVLAAAWLVRWRAKVWLNAAVLSQGVVAALFLTCILAPSVAERLGLANSFKRAKGWEAMTEQVIERARTEPGLTSIAVNDRFLFNAASYYGRDALRSGALPPLVMWLRAATPQTQAELTDPLTPMLGRKVLAVSLENVWLDEMRADFTTTADLEIISVRLDRARQRSATLFTGTRFEPAPRDPTTGLPVGPQLRGSYGAP